MNTARGFLVYFPLLCYSLDFPAASDSFNFNPDFYLNQGKESKTGQNIETTPKESSMTVNNLLYNNVASS